MKKNPAPGIFDRPATVLDAPPGGNLMLLCLWDEFDRYKEKKPKRAARIKTLIDKIKKQEKITYKEAILLTKAVEAHVIY